MKNEFGVSGIVHIGYKRGMLTNLEDGFHILRGQVGHHNRGQLGEDDEQAHAEHSSATKWHKTLHLVSIMNEAYVGQMKRIGLFGSYDSQIQFEYVIRMLGGEIEVFGLQFIESIQKSWELGHLR